MTRCSFTRGFGAIRAPPSWETCTRVIGCFPPGFVQWHNRKPVNTEPKKKPDNKPAIFIAKYNRILDTQELDLGHLKDDSKHDHKPDKTTGLEPGISKYLVKAVHQTSSLEKLTLELNKDWSANRLDPKKLPQYYLQLSKSRLTMLVAITSAAGYGMAPMESLRAGCLLPVNHGVSCSSPPPPTPSTSTLEVPFDSQMNRTKNRVLVRGLFDPSARPGVCSGGWHRRGLDIGVYGSTGRRWGWGC